MAHQKSESVSGNLQLVGGAIELSLLGLFLCARHCVGGTGCNASDAGQLDLTAECGIGSETLLLLLFRVDRFSCVGCLRARSTVATV